MTVCWSELVPGYAAPARAEDLAGLPRAFVCVGALDGFRDPKHRQPASGIVSSKRNLVSPIETS